MNSPYILNLTFVILFSKFLWNLNILLKKYLNLRNQILFKFRKREKTCQNKPLCSAESGAERARESIVTVGGVMSLFLPSFDMHCK